MFWGAEAEQAEVFEVAGEDIARLLGVGDGAALEVVARLGDGIVEIYAGGLGFANDDGWPEQVDVAGVARGSTTRVLLE